MGEQRNPICRQEIDQAKRLADDPAWRRGRIRDVIAVHEVIVELMEKLERGLAARRVDLSPLFSDEKSAHAAFAKMASYDVAVTMKASYHRGATHAWTPNDINDIDALGSTLPYCDIVVTDEKVAAHATRTGLAERLGATVLSRLDDLVGLLYVLRALLVRSGQRRRRGYCAWQVCGGAVVPEANSESHSESDAHGRDLRKAAVSDIAAALDPQPSAKSRTVLSG